MEKEKQKYLMSHYLEIVDLNSKNFQKLEFDPEIKPYPFSEKELLEYLVSDEFLKSIDYNLPQEILKNEDGKIVVKDPKDPFVLKEIVDNIPAERKQEEINQEKRRRHQAYKLLEYNLSQHTYFDYFSYDAFKLARKARMFAHILNRTEVSLEMLVFTFFDEELEIGKILKNYRFNEILDKKFFFDLKYTRYSLQKVKEFLFQMPSKTVSENFFEIVKVLKNFSKRMKKNFKCNIDLDKGIFELQLGNKLVNPIIKFNYEVHSFFEKSAENSKERFKTPIITPEILFITLMEEKESFLGNLIEKHINDETSWYLLRYKLLKRIHMQEVNVRTQVSRNQQFFAYLLKLQMNEKLFEKLIKNKKLAKAVSLFRDVLIANLLKYASSRFNEDFEREIHMSIALSPKRYYE